MRIGYGCDRHRLQAGDGLVIGGIRVPSELSAVAHSDGDVLLHALTDALLGAVGGPDIGELFSDTDEANRGRNSADFVTAAMKLVKQKQMKVANADLTILLQMPKLSPYKNDIRNNVAALLEIEPEQVSVKAKTGEKVGPVGLGEAVEAVSAVLLEDA